MAGQAKKKRAAEAATNVPIVLWLSRVIQAAVIVSSIYKSWYGQMSTWLALWTLIGLAAHNWLADALIYAVLTGGSMSFKVDIYACIVLCQVLSIPFGAKAYFASLLIIVIIVMKLKQYLQLFGMM